MQTSQGPPRRRNERTYPRFSDKEYERRRRLVKEMMKRQGVEALLIYSSSQYEGSVHYLSNYLAKNPCYLIYPIDGEPTLIIHFYNHIPCTSEMSIVKDIQWHHHDPVKQVTENLEKKGLTESKIGLVRFNNIPYAHYMGITDKLPKVRFVDVSKDYNWIRWVRSEEEIEWYRRSAYLTDLTMEALEREIRPGLSEFDLDDIVHSAYARDGGQLWIDFIASTSMDNPDVFVPWQLPTPRVLNVGDVVITEITVGYYGYFSQIHRPFAVAREPNALYRKLYDVALECYERVARVLRPGATTKDVIEATSVIEENGFTVYDSLVHGESAINPELGSKTSAHPKEEFTFRENMLIVIQPQPITLDYKAGIQLGAATIVTQNGAKSLHNYPFKFPVCGGNF